MKSFSSIILLFLYFSISSQNLLSSQVINISFQTQDEACDQKDGWVRVTVTGGSGGFHYKWDNNLPDTNYIDKLSAGTYNLTVTDSNQDSSTIQVTIINLPEPFVLLETTPATCPGTATGNITSQIISSNGPVSYAWSTGDTTPDIYQLYAGMYSLTVTDARGCIWIDSVYVIDPDEMIVSYDSTRPACGKNDGLILANVIGGNSPYQFKWSTGANSPFIDNLSPGTYYLTITDDNACTQTDSVVLQEIKAPVLTLSPVDPACTSTNSGWITSQVIGGNGGNNYLWSNNATTSFIANLYAGQYGLTVTDQRGCKDSVQITLNDPPKLNLQVDSIDLKCYNDSSGEAIAMVTGGTQPYQYFWNNGDTVSHPKNLNAGNYRVTITDKNNCQTVGKTTLYQPDSIALTPTLQHPKCFGDSTASIVVTLSGGTPNYSYAWNTGDTNAYLLNIPAGKYNLTITDGNQCIKHASYDILQPDSIQILRFVTPVQCHGMQNGQISVQVNGGTPGYSYLWNTGSTDSLIKQLGPGQYGLTITDNIGCRNSIIDSVFEPDSMTIAEIIVNPKCFGESSGSINLIVSGGNGGLNFKWNTGDTIVPLFQISAGEYLVTVTDKNGCTDSGKYLLTQPDSLWTEMNKEDAQNGKANGKAYVKVHGGVPPYQYVWDANAGNQTSDTAFGLLPGKYFVTVTDKNGCSIIDSAIIDVIIGIDKNTSNSFVRIFPVPANELIHFKINPVDEIVTINIQNVTGNSIFRSKLNPGIDIASIEISNWPAGMYIVQLSWSNQRISQKIMVIH
jgi:SprB repeat/Secretion system C-terminal sorting domain